MTYSATTSSEYIRLIARNSCSGFISPWFPTIFATIAQSPIEKLIEQFHNQELTKLHVILIRVLNVLLFKELIELETLHVKNIC